MRIAVIDLGSNSIRLDIRDFYSSLKSKRVFKVKLVVRLGQDVFLTGRLNAQAKTRTIKVFRSFARIIKQYHATKVVALGTSALRSAKDSAKFITRVKKESGIRLKKLSGDAEARLIALAVLNTENVSGKYSGLIDIGGGSTEIISFDHESIGSKKSFDVGSVRIHESFLFENPPKQKKDRDDPIFTARQYIRKNLKDYRAPHIKLFYGTSDTVRIIARVFKLRGEKNCVSLPLLSAFIGEISTLNLEKIRAIKGMDPQRADIILSGAIILEEMMRYFCTEVVVPSKVSLRDGIFLDATKRIKWE